MTAAVLITAVRASPDAQKKIVNGACNLASLRKLWGTRTPASLVFMPLIPNLRFFILVLYKDRIYEGPW